MLRGGLLQRQTLEHQIKKSRLLQNLLLQRKIQTPQIKTNASHLQFRMGVTTVGSRQNRSRNWTKDQQNQITPVKMEAVMNHPVSLVNLKLLGYIYMKQALIFLGDLAQR